MLKNNKNNKKAFTFVEIVIVLTIIGILVAMLLPSLYNAVPNKNIFKFKRANSSLFSTVSNLTKSGKHYSQGDLGRMPDGTLVTSSTYFCETLADTITTKSVNCNNSTGVFDKTAVLNLEDAAAIKLNNVNVDEIIDCMCANNLPPNNTADIVTLGGASFYIINPHYHFGSIIPPEIAGGQTLTAIQKNRIFNDTSKSLSEKRYKYICMDIDSIGSGEAPFGYALSADGKILLGKRAKAWIDASVHDKEVVNATVNNSVCASLATPTLTIPNDNLEDTVLVNNSQIIDGNNLRMTSYNMGDNELKIDFASLGILSLDTKSVAINYTVGGSCNYRTDNCDTPICWQGETANQTACVDINNYSSCNRVVCNWQAARIICESFGWRLPSTTDLNNITGTANYSKATSLGLCSENNNSTKCGYIGLCPGARYSICRPYLVWKDSYITSSATPMYAGLSRYSFNQDSTYTYFSSAGGSVRCVK